MMDRYLARRSIHFQTEKGVGRVRGGGGKKKRAIFLDWENLPKGEIITEWGVKKTKSRKERLRVVSRVHG